MNVQAQADAYIAGQPAAKRSDMLYLHAMILAMWPGCKLWYFDGRDESGKVVSNPTIGYGAYTITYADGKTKEFFRLGLSANATGISVYIMGLSDKTYLANTYGDTIGKAKVTGYLIRFKALKDIKPDVLEAALRYGKQASE